MSTFVVLGAQWGDEGKGKMTDFLAESADLVVRFQGGNNAGHTVIVGESEYKLHLIPSGILYDDKLNILGNGTVIDPEALFKEISYLEDLNVEVTPEKLLISDRAHVILPYHRLLDKASDKLRKNAIGTTGKGIGPAYTDKAERSGIRMCDLIKPDVFKRKLEENIKKKNDLLVSVYDEEPLDFDEVYETYSAYAERLIPFVKDTSVRLYDEIKADKKVLFEGAQGMLLDIDYGTYPFVTSSNTIAGGVCTGTGIGPTMLKGAVGVAKAYTTRVGEGPFPTELTDETGRWIQEKGGEVGVTTGRPRRCGWLDLVILKTSARVSGLTNLVVTKIDTLAGLDTIEVCVGYKFNGQMIDYFPASLEDLAACEPVYETFEGWGEEAATAKTYDELPENAKIYLKRIEEFTGVEVSIVSVGPKRDQTIVVNEI
ncbi:Adenylosuccinate synthetase [Alkalibacterium putridalgicola]|uniref:Adenylosuccinate synthetase n=1 Tax=Alkalibacterium putridalgicola TaxID=426703 RepID=A0A1H7TWN3_9LACT|nr:adenylosuccinate synthase [Alkalibacterium putridalgicola]GEK88593.1 adenylosuccinate synthetase [Alkalibacterium putridalgicola]SEL88826.1 Adenylosuccinate synthetase [Alkalibacterium putridalgicola]